MADNTMKAVLVTEFGRPFEITDIPIPAVAPGEMLVKVDTAGIIFGEMLIATGKYQVRPHLPFVPGTEFSGTVVEVGRELKGFAVGDRIAATGFVGDSRIDRKVVGSLAEYRAIPPENAVKIPDSVSLEQAALFRSNNETSFFGLYKGGLKAGETLLVMGASGGTGFAAVQIGKLLGAKVIASCSSEEKRSIALAAGADVAVDSHAGDWREQIHALTDGRGLDVVYDPVGGFQTERAFRALGWDGRHVVIGFAAGEIAALPANLPLLKGASLVGANLLQGMKFEWDEVIRQRVHVMGLFGEGKLSVPPVALRFPLEKAQDAYDAVASGTIAGRIVVKTPSAE